MDIFWIAGDFINGNLQETKIIYRFGAFRLDAAERRLWCDDEPISLTPKQFDLLFYFVENVGRVKKKSELLDAVWTDTYIEESTLARNVSWLRKKLAEYGADGEGLIETVPKLGYRFTAQVTRPAEDEYTLIVEEQTIQHIRGEEVITIYDAEIKTQRSEAVESKNSISPNLPVSSRRRVAASLILFITFVALAGIGFVVSRNQLNTNAETTGLNVKATITVKNITVDATQETVDTGLKVQPGDTIKISAMGIHQHGTDQTWTLAGDKTAKASADFAFQNADPRSLVAWIGNETDKTSYFQVSKNHTVKSDSGGYLFLTINDRKPQYTNNRGGLTVAVILLRTYSIYAEDTDFEAAWGNELVRLYKEDTLAIRGRGDVSYWQGGELYDLNGSDHDTYGHLEPTINARSLIGKIGSRTPFKVGMDYPQQTMKVSGGLFLTVNDRITDKPGSFTNNSGEISVDIEVVRQPEAFKNPI